MAASVARYLYFLFPGQYEIDIVLLYKCYYPLLDVRDSGFQICSKRIGGGCFTRSRRGRWLFVPWVW